MKANSKFTLGMIAGLTIVATFITTTPSGAVTGTGASCTRITTLQSTTQATIATHIATMKTDFATRLTGISTRETTVDQSVATARANISTKFAAKVKELEAQAGLTPVQLTAIDAYKADMIKAEATREAAVDAARSAYRTSLAAEVQTHQTSLSSDVAAYQTAVTTAFTTAVANCGDGTALATLRSDVKTAHQTLETARKADKVTTDIKAFATTRNDAIKAADTAFATSAAAYTATLTTILEAVTNSPQPNN